MPKTKRKLKILDGDIALWVIFVILSGISLIAVYSTIGLSAIHDMNSTPMAIFFRHMAMVVGTYIEIFILSLFNYRKYSRASLWLFILSIILLLLVLFIGDHRWLSIPHVARFQPSEIAKVVLVVFLARCMALNRDRLDEKNTFYVLLIPVVAVCVLVAPENLSTAILIFVTCYLMLYFGGVNRKMWWSGVGIFTLLAVFGIVLLYFFGDKIDLFRTSTWGHRLQNWLHPNPNELSQENMAKMAVARGGFFFHNGIGTTIHGRLMTQAHNDFIFAIIIEEAGSLTGAFIFALYAWFYFRCIRIASRCRGMFGSLSVAGIGTMVFLQAIIHMCVSLGVVPVTGQTLPFISYGGTAYLFMGLGIGVIQSVAATTKREMRQETKNATAESEQTSSDNPVNTQTI